MPAGATPSQRIILHLLPCLDRDRGPQNACERIGSSATTADVDAVRGERIEQRIGPNVALARRLRRNTRGALPDGVDEVLQSFRLHLGTMRKPEGAVHGGPLVYR